MKQEDIEKFMEEHNNRKRVTEFTKTEIKNRAKEEIMAQLAGIGYHIREFGTYNEEEADILLTEIKYQMDRIAVSYGYPEAWFN